MNTEIVASSSKTEALSEAKQYCTFYLDDLLFGVEVLKVQEVFRYQEMTRVPLAPREVRGLINLRGQIITALDMRRRLQMEERADGKMPMNIVVRSNDGIVSLLVDEIGDVLEVPIESYEPSPETIEGIIRELVQGVYKLKENLLLVLDTEKAIHL